MTGWKTIAAVALFCVTPLLAAGDKGKTPQSVEDLIAKGLKAYKDGKPQEAIAALQAAIGVMQKALEKDLAKFIPAAPEGWEAGEVKSSSAAGSFGEGSTATTNVERKYTKKGEDGQEVSISLITTKELVEAQRSIVETYRKNPEIIKAMQSADTQFALIDQDGWIGWKVINKKSNAQVILFCKTCMFQIEVRKSDEAVLNTFFKAVDLKGLAAALPAPAAAPAK